MDLVEGFRNASRFKFAAAFERLEDLTIEELEEFEDRKDVPVLELICARGMLKVLDNARPLDVQTFRELMCGPEPKQVELSGRNGEPLNPLSKMPASDLIAVYQEIQALTKGEKCKSTRKQQPSLESSAQSSPPASDTES